MFCMHSVMVFFFFKQKTAYDMRIRDWSSDVCSSDLFGKTQQASQGDAARWRVHLGQRRRAGNIAGDIAAIDQYDKTSIRRQRRHHPVAIALLAGAVHKHLLARKKTSLEADVQVLQPARSEEHTSELQSLMRISYAVFCLK